MNEARQSQSTATERLDPDRNAGSKHFQSRSETERIERRSDVAAALPKVGPAVGMVRPPIIVIERVMACSR
jgi:hypothetical protein